MTTNVLPPVLDDATIAELRNHYRGKVRDNYDLPDGRRILIASDRLSAFDRILAAIPCKGQVLTQTARYWFEATKDLCPNHVLEYPDPNVVVARRLDILPVEMVVRHARTPTREIVRFAQELQPDLIVMGAHGHKGLKDIVFGTTINAVRHKLKVPLLIVRGAK